MYPQGVCRIRKPAYAGNGCAIFPTFSDEEWTEKIRSQPQTIYSVLPNGGGFSAVPLKPASYQFSCRDKKIAPGGTGTESLWVTESNIKAYVLQYN